MAKKARMGTKKAARPEGPFFRPFSDLKKASGSGLRAPGSRTPPVARRVEPEARSPKPEASSDADAFAIYMAGVQALDGKATRIPRTASRLERAPAPPAPVTDPDEPARASMASLVSEGIRFDVTDDGERIEGRRLDVDPRELGRLRRGQYPIDGKLDLHGMAVPEARAAVEAFVRKRRLEGDRAIMIVHGKGNHSPGGVGVLRGEIGAWLSQGRAARDVAAFASVSAAGAVQVLLAR